MLNRHALDTAYQELVRYTEMVSQLTTLLGTFLHTAPPAAIVAPTETSAEPATPAAVPPAPRSARAPHSPRPTAEKKTPTPKSPAAQRILEALSASPEGTARPGDLVETLSLSAYIFKKVLTGLEDQKLVTVSGATVNRRVTITEKGRKAIAIAPAAARPQTEAELVAARDKAVKDRLKTGPATFAQLLATLPGDFPSADAKTTALNASLRRLTLRSEVLDAGDQFKLRAA